MMNKLATISLMALLMGASGMDCRAADLVWYDGNKAVSYQVEGSASPVVSIALDLFKSDLQQVTGKTPEQTTKQATIHIVQLDKATTKQLAALRKKGVPVDELQWKMDGFYLHVDQEIWVVGNNGRGTAYGILELSRKAGVSPWVWWGDVTPDKKNRLTLEKGFTTLQSPSVEYRGIFLNDEDFTLRNWSNRFFEPSKNKGNIGPKTYKKLFELMLRLRANTIWPGMHTGTTAFFKVKGNKEMADSCDIVVGTSHCEPLLRNNVDEWDINERGRFNYITNKESVQNYWIERLKQVAGGTNYFYTIGMRGIHDGHMEGVNTMKEKTTALQQVINDQRTLLGTYINKDVTKVPQVFVPYKEVLQIMENGLNVPDDVTLMWCDDNYGYMTRLSNAEQQKRSGGAGVYYHLSYWGQPHDYMWLTTEQPGLLYNEMKEAYDYNARKLWIVNVHEPKVAAYELELFLDMAWNINSVSANTLEQHLQNWLSVQFGKEIGSQLLPVMKEWYRLVGIRRPEFMGWSQTELDKKKYKRGWSPVVDSEFSMTEFGNEMERYLKDYSSLVSKVEQIAQRVNPSLKDAYFAAVTYPIKASAAMAEKMLEAQKARRTDDEEAGKKASAAHDEIISLTKYYNSQLAGGKWKYNMCWNPRELLIFNPPSLSDTLPKIDLKAVHADNHEYIARNACRYDKADGKVSTVEMLGHSMKTVSLPKGCSLTYRFETKSEGEAVVYTALIPTQPNDKGDLRYSVSIDGGAPVVISLKEKFRSNQWKLNVLRGQALNKTSVNLGKGTHTLVIKALDNHVLVDQWMVDFAKDRKFYVIPAPSC